MILALLLAAAAAAAQPAPETKPEPAAAPGQCFLVSQFRDWRDADARTLYVRVNVHDVYRLDLSAACPVLTFPNAQLVLNTDGVGQICSAADWDLRVSRGVGGADTPVSCRVSAMTRLSPGQAAALPPRLRPE